MEILAHALLGAIVGEWMFGQRMGNRALAWGMAAGLLPFLFAVVLPFLDAANRMAWQYGPSHSVFTAGWVAWLLSKPLARHWKRLKITRLRAGAFIFATWCAHIALDVLGPAGVAIVWPIPLERVSADLLTMGDPLLLLPWLIAIPWIAACRNPKCQVRRRKIFRWAGAVCLLHVLACATVKSKLNRDLDEWLATCPVAPEHQLMLPARHTSWLWRVCIQWENEIWVTYRSIFQKQSIPPQWMVYPRGLSADGELFNEREIRRIRSHTRGFWIARQHKRGLWIADVTSGEIIESGSRDTEADLRMRQAWNFETNAPKDRLIPAHAPHANIFMELQHNGSRLFDTHLPTHRNIRLAGVTGQFPEPLMLRESTRF